MKKTFKNPVLTEMEGSSLSNGTLLILDNVYGSIILGRLVYLDEIPRFVCEDENRASWDINRWEWYQAITEEEFVLWKLEY